MNGLLNQLPLTKIKILCARLLYLLTTLVVGKQARVIVRDGIRYEVDLAEGMELSLFLFGGFQRHVTRNSFINIQPDHTIIDIGANVGLMTLQFAKLVPRGHVYAFEPTGYALERLKRNLALNPELAARVSVINAFVSETTDANPDIIAYSSWKVDGGHGGDDHPVHWGTPKSTAGVAATSLNDFVVRHDIRKLDFVKIDTDGHEYEVFKGADQAIARLRPTIIFEIGLYVMAEKGIDFRFYHDYFRRLNYRLVDAVSEREVKLDNYRRIIPRKGSTDLLALPL